jgi:hypothetical protein
MISQGILTSEIKVVNRYWQRRYGLNVVRKLIMYGIMS